MKRRWILTVSSVTGFITYMVLTSCVYLGRPFPQDHIVRGKSPSPTHIASVSAAHLRATYGHQCHESDTLRSAARNLPPQQPIQLQSTSPKLSEPPQTQHVPVALGRSRRSPTTSEPVLVGGEDEVANVPVSEVRTRNLVVSKKAYARLDLIGKGGSSHVYRVTNNANETCDQTRFT